jgi:hypothetical protein
MPCFIGGFQTFVNCFLSEKPLFVVHVCFACFSTPRRSGRLKKQMIGCRRSWKTGVPVVKHRKFLCQSVFNRDLFWFHLPHDFCVVVVGLKIPRRPLRCCWVWCSGGHNCFVLVAKGSHVLLRAFTEFLCRHARHTIVNTFVTGRCTRMIRTDFTQMRVPIGIAPNVLAIHGSIHRSRISAHIRCSSLFHTRFGRGGAIQ